MAPRATVAGEHDHGGTIRMKGISRRLRQLEEGLGIGPETEFTRRLRERIWAGLRRVAEVRARGESQAHESEPLAEVRHKRLLEAAGFRQRQARRR